jgi:hypothetical protein
MATTDKRFSIAGWLVLSYFLSSYAVWGIAIMQFGMPHGGPGPMVVVWLLAPVIPFQSLSGHVGREGVQFLLWHLVTFAACLVALYLWRGIDKRKRFLDRQDH